MPRSIQMGTTPPNKLCQPPAPLPPLTPPDLLSGVGASHSSDTSVTSRDTVTTPASSSCSPDPMEVIIRDLRPAEERWRVAEPLIGHAHQPHRPPAPRSAPPSLSCSCSLLMLMLKVEWAERSVEVVEGEEVNSSLIQSKQARESRSFASLKLRFTYLPTD